MDRSRKGPSRAARWRLCLRGHMPVGLLLALAALLVHVQGAQAQDWAFLQEDESELQAASAAAAVAVSEFQLVATDSAALQAALLQAPHEEGLANGQSVILNLPMPDGTVQRFHIAEYTMMDDALRASVPTVRTYRGWGVDDPTATARLIWTSSGFQGMVLNDNGTSYVDALDADDGLYRSYDGRALPKEQWGERMQFAPVTDFADIAASSVGGVDAVDVGENLHIYRLAVAATGEFTQKYGNKQAAKEGIATIINQLNGLYERDLAIRFVLVDNDNIIYESPTGDPYSTPVNFTAIGRQLTENQANLDNPDVLGSANYDIGHVFGIGGGGIGAFAGPCVEGRKAQGASNTGNPQNPAWITGLLAHELAHQFTANHTFNGSCQIEGQSQRGPAGAIEPGSGSTVMSYGGVCAPQNIVNGSDPYFHAFSIQEITTYVNNPQTGGSCGTHNASGNAVPNVNAGTDTTIPAGTPFKLVGAATDGNNDNLSYTWEQFDRGSEWTDANTPVLPNRDLGDNPIFRSYPPVPSATRFLPDFTSSASAIGEALPTTNRTLNFRLSVRDGKGGVGSDDVQITVNSAAGPFAVTAPAAGSFWTPNAQSQVTWDVANTNQAPIGCNSVNILASNDGGQTFTALVNGTPNDGSQNVTAPASGNNVLIKVECADAGQIFYAISAKPGVQVCAPILQNDFEGGAAGWVVGGPDNPPTSNYKQWTLNTDGGSSGSNYWFVDNDRNQQFTTLTSPQLTATSEKTTVSFVQKYQFYALTNQSGKVQLQVNGGAWEDLTAYTGELANYTNTVLDVSDKVKANDTFRIRFRRENNSNSWMILNSPRGWSLDDVLVCASSNQVVDPGPTDPPTVPDTGDRTWTGATSSDWADDTNWTPQKAPTDMNNAVIPAGLARYPTIAADAAVNAMQIGGGATVNMTGGTLTVHGNWGSKDAAGDDTGNQPIQVCRTFGATEGAAGTQKPLDPPTTLDDTLTVATGGPIADLNLFLDVSHTWMGDVVATLRHEDTGTEVTVFQTDDVNCSGDNMSLTLDDEAGEASASACTGGNPAFTGNRYRPANALSAFNGEVSTGQWKLTLTDRYPTVDSGRLNQWCVNITPVNAGGAFNATGGTVVFAGAQNQTVRTVTGSIFNNVQIGAGGSSQEVQLSNSMDINGNLTISGAAILNAGGAQLNIAGNWQQPATANFVPGTGSVIFDGAVQTVGVGAAGSVQAVSFYGMTVNQGSTVDFGFGFPSASQQLINNGAMRQTKEINNSVALFSSGGYGGVIIDPGAQPLGTTSVTIGKVADGCTAKAGETVQRCFTIDPANKTGRNATLWFYYNQNEQSGNSCSFMNGYQNDNSGTELPELTVAGRACTGALRSVTVSGVTDFTTTAFTLGSDVGGDNKRADDPPVAVEDTVVLQAGQEEYVIDVLFNDFDPEGLAVTLDFVGDAGNGATEIDRTSIKYKPAEGFVGEDTFTYEISDIGSQTASTTVTVTVLPADANEIYLPSIWAD